MKIGELKLHTFYESLSEIYYFVTNIGANFVTCVRFSEYDIDIISFDEYDDPVLCEIKDSEDFDNAFGLMKKRLNSALSILEDFDANSLTFEDFKKDILFETIIDNDDFKNIHVCVDLRREYVPVKMNGVLSSFSNIGFFLRRTFVKNAFYKDCLSYIDLPNKVISAIHDKQKDIIYREVRPCNDNPKYILYHDSRKKIDLFDETKGLQKTTIFRFLKNVVGDMYTEEDINVIGNKYIASHCSLKVVKVKKESIPYVYSMSTEDWGYKSCMSYKPQIFFDMYRDSPDIDLYAIINCGRLVGRFLIVNANIAFTNEKFKYADRIYCDSEYVKSFYIEWCKKQGLFYKSSTRSTLEFTNPDDGNVVIKTISLCLPKKISMYPRVPYIDTLRYAMSKNSDRLYNQIFNDSIEKFSFDNTDGTLRRC